MLEDPDWVSASDLAEYAYCPRAFWYRKHPPAGMSASNSDRSSRRGQRFHRRELGAERKREAHAGGYVALVLFGIALLSTALYFAGFL